MTSSRIRGTSPLLDRPLHFVVGKGGVGKTTVAAALALAGTARGKKVLLVELDAEDHVSGLLGFPQKAGIEARRLEDGLFHMNVQGREALEEYLGMIVPVRRILKTVFSSRIYQYFVAAAPGLRELMTIGKIWYEVREKDWDLVIVDCPATGHALQYLRMPKSAADTFRSGLVHREALRVWGLLKDPDATEISLVTLAEEMPVNESIELARELRDALGLPLGNLWVNRRRHSKLDEEAIARIEEDTRPAEADAPWVEAAFRRARFEAAWAERSREMVETLRRESGLEPKSIPYLARESFGRAEVEEIAKRIVEASEAGS